MTVWTLQDAKDNFAYLAQQALSSGEQEITVEDGRRVTVIASAELRRLRQQPQNLADFLLASPLRGLHIPARNEGSDSGP